MSNPRKVATSLATMSVHRRIINTMHARRGAPFAIWEIRDASGASTSSIKRALRKLEELRLVTRMSAAYQNRNYKVTKSWPVDVELAIQTYEYARMLGI